jgi:hypothetical protein
MLVVNCTNPRKSIQPVFLPLLRVPFLVFCGKGIRSANIVKVTRGQEKGLMTHHDHARTQDQDARGALLCESSPCC